MNGPSVVITGSALVTSLGLTRDDTWRAILAGRCGMGPMNAIESPLPSGADGGQAMDLPADFAVDLPREARYLKWALEQAVRDAGMWNQLPARTGVMLGTTLHGMRAAGQFFRSGNPEALKHFLAGSTLDLAIRDLNITDFCATTCSACSSSLGAIALATTLLQSGQLDLVLAGGYDTISEYVYGGFNSLRLVAEGPLRPFSRHRQGMKLAEGYGIVVLERSEDAAKRGVDIKAVIAGFGESADAHHLTQPHPEGRGANQAITAAIQSADLPADQIQMVAAHATATPDNDAGEYAALKQTFGERLPTVPVVAFKSHLGHTLGGAGACELILSTCALHDQTIPACANSDSHDIEFPGLNLSVHTHPADLKNTLNTSLGFGGANTAVVLSRGHVPETPASPQREVAITGIGVVLPGAVGNQALIEMLSQDSPALNADTGSVSEDQYLHLLNARRVRRMSDYVKLSLAAATLATRDAGIADDPALLQDCSVLLGTTHGSSNYSVEYYRQIVAQGLAGANPMLFAEAVPNSAAAHLSLMLGIRGACQTIIGTRTAGLDALNLAALRIGAGKWTRAIVGAAEEYCPTVNAAYRHCGLYAGDHGAKPFTTETGFIVGAGAVCLTLEDRATAEKQGRHIYGLVTATAAARRCPSSELPMKNVLEKLDPASLLLSSANATWIDRAEQIAAQGFSPMAKMRALYGQIAETFSATPLVGIAALLLNPQLFSPAPVDHFAALCTGYSGTAAGTAISVRRKTF
ncbi:MAG TPA: beta-ketoacyl-[acyl-carrier-protein] synthase family protein [Tepidisphaeraceae bacterium]|nr:beta-ketoacyl-[acyl-carrier-protein] synthase family protein [Tepidisphaeraceae bacterium]